MAKNTKSNGSTIANRALVVSLKISRWSGRKKDDAVNATLASTYGSEAGMHSVTKHLIGKEALETITEFDGAARELFYEQCAPWQDEGSRLLLTKKFEEFDKEMMRIKAGREQAVAQFVEDYDKFVDDARTRLATMFVESDYPSPIEIEDKFSFAVQYSPVPSVDDWRFEVDAATKDRLVEEALARERALVQIAQDDAGKKAKVVLERMVERLEGYSRDESGAVKGKFRDTLVSNVMEVANLLPGLNVAEDPRMDAIAKRMQELAGSATPQQLREDDALRADVARRAREIMGEFSPI